MEIYLKALGFIFLAEMGDKTQVLAMVLATRYKLKDVLIGILIGTLLNHGLAIFLGMGLMLMIPVRIIQIMTGALFILFAYWTLKYEEDDEDEEKTVSRIPMIAVAVLFFIGELGDKTQLTAITLAIDNHNAWLTLLGTTSGMLITSGIGIALGIKFGTMINEHLIKYVSSSIFLMYGFFKLMYLMEKNAQVMLLAVFVFSIYLFLFRKYYKLARMDQLTAFQRAATDLYKYRENMADNIELACLGKEHCATCDGMRCSIGYLKYLIQLLSTEETDTWVRQFDELKVKEHSRIQRKILKESLLITVSRLGMETELDQVDTKEEIRRTLETILYGKIVQTHFDQTNYVESLKEVDRSLAQKISDTLEKIEQ